MHDEPVVERISSNVFADLGYPNPEEAAKLLGIDQPKVSRLTRGHVREFSLERLIHFLGVLDRRIDIVVHSTKRRRKNDYLSVIAA